MPLSLLPDIVLPPPASVVGDAKADVLSTASRVSTRGSRTLAPHQGALDAQAVEMLYEATPAQGRAPLCSHDRALRGRAYNGRAELAASPFAPFSPVDETVFLEEEFYLTQSRVVLMSHLRYPMSRLMSAMVDSGLTATMPDAYMIRQGWPGPKLEEDAFWVIYSTHEEAASSLALSHLSIATVAPALETDLEPFEKLERIETRDMMQPDDCLYSSAAPESPTRLCSTPSSSSGSSVGPPTPTTPALLSPSALPKTLRSPFFAPPQSRFTLSSNPPNPKITYRPGDWICSLPTCGAYNFGRNMTCIGCGNPHPYATHHTSPATQNAHLAMNINHRAPPAPHPQQHFVSPRFAAHLEDRQRQRRPLPPLPPSAPPARYHASLPSSRHPSPPHSNPQSPAAFGTLTLNSKLHQPTYPLLTPSGHALSAGGRVRNISMDPSSPCIVYWPDNEPLPERGQIRPSGSTVLQFPPIVNTGNKGAAERQPGDWICSKCHYLNWRRRKVCQTCYPYAEGNGDSISQAVQAERIALLTNLLNQAENAFPHPHQRRASVPINSMNPQMHAPAPFPPQMPRHSQHASLSGQHGLPHMPAPGPSPASRSRSQIDLHAQYQQRQQDASALALQYAQGLPQRPIYQTPAYHASRNSSPARSSYDCPSRGSSPTRMFLPLCLQDVIRAESPVHSSPATSTSSADLSFDDFAYDSHFDIPSAEEPQFRAPGGATRSSGGRKVYNGHAAGSSSQESIWKMDGEESKTLRPYAPIHTECLSDLAGRLASGLSLTTA